MYTRSDPVEHVPNETHISPENRTQTSDRHSTSQDKGGVGFTQVYQGPRTPQPFYPLPYLGVAGGHALPRSELRLPHTFRLPRSSASTPDTQSHTRTPTQPGHSDSPTPHRPHPQSTHTRARAPSPPPAGPHHLRGPGMTVAILLPGSCPKQVPAGRSSSRTGGQARRPPIHSFPGGREYGGHSQSGRRGGPAPAMLGVVVPAWGRAGSRGDAGAEVGPRQRGHAHMLTHTHTWTHGLTPGLAHGHLHTKSHIHSRFPRRLTHTPLPHPTYTHIHLHSHSLQCRETRRHYRCPHKRPTDNPARTQTRLADTAPPHPPLPSPSQLQRTLPCGSHSRLPLSQ